MSSENYEANGYKHKFGFSNHLALIAYSISYEKWMQREKCPNNTCLRYHIPENKWQHIKLDDPFRSTDQKNQTLTRSRALPWNCHISKCCNVPK